MEQTQVCFLGSGDAFSAAGRHQAGYLVQSDCGTVLLDCGATTLAAMKRHGGNTAAIDAILLSHLHGDHFAGLPFFFLEYVYVEPRTRPLLIAGPPGTADRVQLLYQTMYREAASKALPFPLQFMELVPDRPAQAGGLRVLPFRVPHQENGISLGFRLEAGNRGILYSGDTGWTDDLVAQSRGTDLFICECSFFETRVPSHLDYPRLQENERRFETKRLVLTHLGREVLVRSGEVTTELATDGLVVRL